MKLKLNNHLKFGETPLQRFDIAFLRDTDKLIQFKIDLNNRFEASQNLLKEEETTVEKSRKVMEEALTTTFQEKWIFVETLNSIQGKKKIKTQAENTELNKQVKMSIIDDMQKYMVDLATTAEKAVREGNMKQLYDTTENLPGKYSEPEILGRNKECKPVTEIQEQRNRWVEYFEDLLNWPPPLNPQDIKATGTDFLISAT
ncbi:unnamed protein product [Schistosoma curassoni]|uniref:Uncharacterized protein n=1 Tax=Schistosoma curassoni TaxID=6186 RepID=A0A183L0K0_9TREM|nr:unnamed protein product [Schistosoma curassoni]